MQTTPDKLAYDQKDVFRHSLLDSTNKHALYTPEPKSPSPSRQFNHSN